MSATHDSDALLNIPEATVIKRVLAKRLAGHRIQRAGVQAASCHVLSHVGYTPFSVLSGVPPSVFQI